MKPCPKGLKNLELWERNSFARASGKKAEQIGKAGGARNLCSRGLEPEALKWNGNFIYKKGSDWILLLGAEVTIMKKHLLWF